MNFSAVECPVCKKKFLDTDDIVVCPECGTPHHRSCYFENGKCANLDKHGSNFVFDVPREEEPKKVEALPSENTHMPFPFMQNTNDGTEQRNPYFSVTTMDVLPNQEIDGIPAGEIDQYVQNNSKKYILSFFFLEKFNRVKSNFAAFIFSYLWLFYRKMYKIGIIFLAVTVISSIAFTNQRTIEYNNKIFTLYVSMLKGETTPEEAQTQYTAIATEGTGNNYLFDGAPMMISMMLRLLLSIKANKWYQQKMKKDVFKSREQTTDMESYQLMLKKRGGVSIVAPILAAVCVFALDLAYLSVLYFVF